MISLSEAVVGLYCPTPRRGLFSNEETYLRVLRAHNEQYLRKLVEVIEDHTLYRVTLVPRGGIVPDDT